ncbi:hypothetical protein SLS59_009032 [Nothophoma quercina]|uniref:Beta-lactamase-related domain-containing protein n=1 Tax=Nothophoma quercina TaxID=749835 RepID=A0ABR3QPT5_9PLEO
MAFATAAFGDNVRKIIDEWSVPGFAIAVVQGDNIRSKILPNDFVLQDPYLTANVTVEDILSHRAGDPGHDDALFGQKAAQPDNAKSITRKLRHLPFNKPLRCNYQYSNPMFTVATHLIETVTGESYPDVVRRRIWEPLGMLNTYHDVTGVEAGNAKDRLSMGDHWDKEKNSYLAIPSYARPEGQGAGCVFSSVSDYAKWVRALLKRAGPLSEEAHKEMVSGRTIIPYEGNEALPRYGHALYALGLQVETYRGYPLIGHDGSYSGFKASMRYLPDQDWGVVMFGNADDAYSVAQILFHQLVDGVIEVPEEDQTDWAAYWRKCWKDDKEERHKDDPDLLLSESLEATYVPLEELASGYVHAGYGTLSLMFTDGKLEADCSDRAAA